MKNIQLFSSSSSSPSAHKHTYINGSCETCGATEGLEYSLVNDCYSVSVGTAKDKTNITIPSSYNGLPVAIIGEYAFRFCSSLTSITIPDSVISIGKYAFYGCSSLKNITIPNSVTSIESDSFGFCSSLENIIIPESVTSIGYSAFLECSSLTSITIPFVGNTLDGTENTNFRYIFGNYSCVPSSLKEVIITGGTSIGDWAFYGCSSLESVIIQGNVKSIGYMAFRGCRSLKNITIPDSVNSIGEYAFLECYKLTYSKYENAEYLGNANNPYVVLISIISKTFKQFCINKNTKMIGEYAFSGCSTLESIIIPNSVTSIGESAFQDCSSLTSITIPDSVTSIGKDAFYGCDSLANITIPNSVTSIGGWAFQDCSSLTSITIPFVGNTLDGTENTYFGYIFGASSYSSDYSRYVPSSLKEVIITGGKSIGFSAFSGCSSLESIIIPNSVTSIGDGAFLGCSSLTNVYYTGTKEQWNSITIGIGNDPLTSAAITYNYVSEEQNNN